MNILILSPGKSWKTTFSLKTTFRVLCAPSNLYAAGMPSGASALEIQITELIREFHKGFIYRCTSCAFTGSQ